MISLATLLGQILIGWLLADFLSGVFHWLEDRIASEQTWLIGSRVILYNRIHHRDVGASLKGSFWYRNRDPIVFVLIVSAPILYLMGPSAILISTILGSLLSNEVHYLAHHPKENKPIRILQEMGIFQAPKHHSLHHSADQDTRYCVLTNFLNPILDRVQIWRRAEKLFAKMGFNPSLGER